MKKWQILTLRDFFTSREKMILISIVFFLEIPFCFSVGDSLIYVYFMVYILAIMGMHTDDDHGINRLFASMPVSRKTWVVSRYAMSLSIVAICLVLMVAESWLVLNMKFFELTIEHSGGFSGLFRVDNFFLGLFIVLLLMAVSFPFYFKWGYSKGLSIGAVVSSLLMAVFIGAFYVVMGIRKGSWAVSSYIEHSGNNRIIGFLSGVGVKAFRELGSLTIGLIMLVFIMITGIVSFGMSLKIYRNREL